MTDRKLSKAPVEAIQDAGGPFGYCHSWGCTYPGMEYSLCFHEGEGDELPLTLDGVILCKKHAARLDGDEYRVVAEPDETKHG